MLWRVYFPLLIFLILLPTHISNSSNPSAAGVKKGAGVSGRFHYASPQSLMETPHMQTTLCNSHSTLTFINSLNLIHNYLRLIYLMVIAKPLLRLREMKWGIIERKRFWSQKPLSSNPCKSLNFSELWVIMRFNWDEIWGCGCDEHCDSYNLGTQQLLVLIPSRKFSEPQFLHM